MLTRDWFQNLAHQATWGSRSVFQPDWSAARTRRFASASGSGSSIVAVTATAYRVLSPTRLEPRATT